MSNLRDLTAVYPLALGFVVGFGLFYAIPRFIQEWMPWL